MTIRVCGRLRRLGVCALTGALLSASTPLFAASVLDETAPERRPVKVVAAERLKIKTPTGEALVPVYASADMSKAQPHVKRAVVMVHGRLRDADKYFALTQRAAKAGAAAGDTLIIAPQFLSNGDAARHDVSAQTARWKSDAWINGEAGKAPFAISSFEVLDGILAHLADRSRFPNLERIVVAAHSAGAQLVQRYAVVGQADKVLAAAGLQPYADGMSVSAPANAASVMRVRYVVANPSSYLYMDATRSNNAPASCREANHWRYGFAEPVPYVQGEVKPMQQRYLTKRVIYMLGGRDVDPNHSALDKTCMAEAQGAHRLERGNNYFAHIQKFASSQNIAPRHTRVEIPGVAHNADQMFNSACGMTALFDAPGCDLTMPSAATAAATATAAPASVVGAGPTPTQPAPSSAAAPHKHR